MRFPNYKVIRLFGGVFYGKMPFLDANPTLLTVDCYVERLTKIYTESYYDQILIHLHVSNYCVGQQETYLINYY